MFFESEIKEKYVVEFKILNNKLFTMVNKNWPDARGGKLIQVFPEKKEMIQIKDYFNSFDLNKDLFYLTVSIKHNTIVYNSKMELQHEIPFVVKLISDKGFYGVTKNDRFLYFYENASRKTKWITSLKAYKCVKIEDQLFVLHLNKTAKSTRSLTSVSIYNGEIEWESKLLDDPNFIPVDVLCEVNGLSFVLTKNNQIDAFDRGSGKVHNSWKFSSKPFYCNNKISSICLNYEELNLKTMEFTKIDMLPEYKNHIERPAYRIEKQKYHIAHGLGFISALQNYDKELDGCKDFVIYAIDLSSHKIVWSHTFKDYNAPDWKKLEYDGKRIYLLGQSGNLYIFEKEEKA